MRQPLLRGADSAQGAGEVNCSAPVSTAGLLLLGLADRFASLGAPALKRPVGPAARLRLPSLEPHVVALRPHAGLEDQRERQREDEHAARAGSGATMMPR